MNFFAATAIKKCQEQRLLSSIIAQNCSSFILIECQQNQGQFFIHLFKTDFSFGNPHSSQTYSLIPRYDKNDSFVTFPIHELDMSNHTIRNPSGQKLLYDLYAVVTHLGKHQTGHFRVSAKSSIDGKWYNFDDSRVLPCEESRIVSRDAYILFYQKKKDKSLTRK